MREPVMNAGVSFPTQPLQQPRVSNQRRWILTLVILLVIALVVTGMGWLQWSAQRGLVLGYPRPSIQLTTRPSGNLLLNQSYQFSAASQGRDLTYHWDFGDQNSSTGQTVNHAFEANGNYTVLVTVTDALGQTSTTSTQVTVLPPPPQASFTFSLGYYYYVSFDASNSSADPSTSITSYNWDFGDGTTDQTTYSGDSHEYSSSGTYTVTLTVTDGIGQQSAPVQATVVI